MKLLVCALALGFALVVALPAAAQPTPLPFPKLPHVAVPIPDGAELKVMDVGPNRVLLWGSCPTPCDTYIVSLAPKTEGVLGRVKVIKFEREVHRGYYSIGGLTPDTEYTVCVWALSGRRQLLLGKRDFKTLSPLPAG